MKRRQFLQSSLLATGALVLPTLKTRAQTAACHVDHKGTKVVGEEKISYEISVCPDTVSNLEGSGAENKIIKFRAWKYMGKDVINKEYKSDHKIKSSKVVKGFVNDYKLETEFLQENKNEFELPREINIKKLSLQYHKEEGSHTVSILDKKGNVYLVLAQVKSDPEDDEACFLTTACVGVLGKSDNCIELNRLRQFRDGHLLDHEAGRELVREYYSIAPGIVRSINANEHFREIYTDIYNEMILPTLASIEEEDHTAAIETYRSYTLKLKETYL